MLRWMTRLGWTIVQNAVAIGLAIGAAEVGVAQIVPDETLGAEGSRVAPGTANGQAVDRIEGGAQRGQNLFHSFREFNIGDGQRVYFVNPLDVRNIFTRVTGSNISDIQGTLGVDGGANLFLMNPNGIVFGQNARLDVRGSFVGTTADAIGFGNQGFFDANDRISPGLLTINPNAFLFNQINAGAIVNRSQANAGVDPSGSFNAFGLRVPEGQSLLLLGGNINIDGGSIAAFGSRVDIGGLAGAGAVGLTTKNNTLRLDFPEGVARADVSLSNGASITTAGQNGGSVTLHARNMDILTSFVDAGIGTNLGAIESQAGDIILDATESITVSGSYVSNSVNLNATGAGGDIIIAARELTIEEGALIRALSSGTGNSGDIKVSAPSVSLDGGTFGLLTGLFAQVNTTGAGNSGDISIQTQRLNIDNGAEIAANTFGQGDAGNLEINASESVNLTGEGFFISGLFVGVESGAEGNAGNLTVNTDRLNISNGARIAASTFGRGNVGSLTIDASESVNISGAGSFPSGLLVGVRPGAEGSAGDLIINTNRLNLREGAEVTASTRGRGNAGNMRIRARDSIEVSSSPGTLTQLNTNVASGAEGNAGNLTIETRRFLVDSAQVSASVRGQGKAGTLTINASESVQLRGEVLAEDGGALFPGGIFAQLDPGSTGQGGSLSIRTDRLSISNGSKIQVATFGDGDAGDLLIRASEVDIFNTVQPFYFTGIFAGITQDPNSSTTLPQGNGGRLTLEVDRLSIRDGSRLTADVSGIGTGGDILIRARDLVEVVGVGDNAPSILGAEVAPPEVNTPVSPEAISGKAGNITIHTRQLSVRDGGRVSVSTFGSGNAGNITIQNAQLVEVTGRPSSNLPSSIRTSVGEGASGRGGQLTISSQVLNISRGGEVSASTSGRGNAGNIRVQGANSIALDNGAITASTNGRGRAGDIFVTAANLEAVRGGQISTSTTTKSRAGNITLQGFNQITLNGRNSGLFARTAANSSGRGGSIRVTTDRLTSNANAEIAASSRGSGQAGNVTINAAELQLGDRSRISVEATRGGTAGDLNITTGQLIIQEGAGVTVRSPQGEAGNLNATANAILLNQGELSATTGVNGGGANINLSDLDILLLQNASRIEANARNRATGGNININSQFIVAAPLENSDITANAGAGDGGRVEITTQGVFGIAARPELTPRSDITATSEQGVQGIVAITQPDADPSRGLTPLPTIPIDATNQIASVCPTNTQQADRLGSFIVSGRGGLPANPIDLLSDDNTLTEWVTASEPSSAKAETSASPQPIVEAQGWVVSPQGKISLVAPATPSPSAPAHCP